MELCYGFLKSTKLLLTYDLPLCLCQIRRFERE